MARLLISRFQNCSRRIKMYVKNLHQVNQKITRNQITRLKYFFNDSKTIKLIKKSIEEVEKGRPVDDYLT